MLGTGSIVDASYTGTHETRDTVAVLARGRKEGPGAGLGRDEERGPDMKGADEPARGMSLLPINSTNYRINLIRDQDDAIGDHIHVIRDQVNAINYQIDATRDQADLIQHHIHFIRDHINLTRRGIVG